MIKNLKVNRWKFGFKVVFEFNNEYHSSFIQNGGVIYKKNESVCPKPNCGPLVLFEIFESAKKYQGRNGSAYKTFSCAYVESISNKVWLRDTCPKNKFTIAVMSHCNESDIALADKLMLLEEV